MGVNDYSGADIYIDNADASSFDMSRLKFCPHCGQLLPREIEERLEARERSITK